MDEPKKCEIREVESPAVGRVLWCETHAIYFGLKQPCPYSGERPGKEQPFGDN